MTEMGGARASHTRTEVRWLTVASVVVAAGVWLVCGTLVGRALHDAYSRTVLESVGAAVLACGAPVALAAFVAAREQARQLGAAPGLRSDVLLVLAHLVVIVPAAAFLARPHGVVLAVILVGVLFIPEALAVGLLRLAAARRAAT
ncbi:hypothetical protein WJ438_00760 [Streptomyces sp. GD-15H]|uniref:hypothetical protein n=1 Tax=Streptomyces sp. GD-15H TaxID=3129112 RepID=UPI00324523E8